MTTKTAAQIIETQDRLNSLSKKSRELAEKIKYDTTFSAELVERAAALAKDGPKDEFEAENVAYNTPRMAAELAKHVRLVKDFKHPSGSCGNIGCRRCNANFAPAP